MRAVNLLPREAVAERRRQGPSQLPRVGAAAVPVIAIGLLVIGYTSGHSAVTAKQAQLTAIQAEITLLQTMAGPPGHVVVAARQFVSSLAIQELIRDVLGAYQLSGHQGSVGAQLGNAIFKIALHQS